MPSDIPCLKGWRSGFILPGAEEMSQQLREDLEKPMWILNVRSQDLCDLGGPGVAEASVSLGHLARAGLDPSVLGSSEAGRICLLTVLGPHQGLALSLCSLHLMNPHTNPLRMNLRLPLSRGEN